ncbi:hypothetical protein RHGRI_026359 [Rhododendron griersonianum]|uniref:Uncharacterized protein n=1 Tax=Rhododendron griersonianum TaxID=479676 RepID=A0AAV6IW15_9ERIC|nr:hypothetical protein RHGRI_026359 [Rhododendron griersonianum]
MATSKVSMELEASLRGLRSLFSSIVWVLYRLENIFRPLASHKDHDGCWFVKTNDADDFAESACKFIVRSIYLTAPEQPLKKASKELFKIDASSASTALEDADMQVTPQEQDQTLRSKKID